jgi:hypothetical protein
VTPLPPEIVDLVESGVSLLVATRDGALRPACVRAFGASVSADRKTVTVFFPQATGARCKVNLDENKRIAVGVSRPFDNLAVQLKGSVTDLHAARDDERVVPERYLSAYVEQLYLAGLPRNLLKRAHVWPAWSATFTLEDVFVQTPGPDAGKRLGS